MAYVNVLIVVMKLTRRNTFAAPLLDQAVALSS